MTTLKDRIVYICTVQRFRSKLRHTRSRLRPIWSSNFFNFCSYSLSLKWLTTCCHLSGIFIDRYSYKCMNWSLTMSIIWTTCGGRNKKEGTWPRFAWEKISLFLGNILVLPLLRLIYVLIVLNITCQIQLADNNEPFHIIFSFWWYWTGSFGSTVEGFDKVK